MKHRFPTGFKPMLAVSCEDRSSIKYPVMATPKIDGIRCLISGGVAWSRKLIPIPNRFIQNWASVHAEMLEGLDGELVSAGTFQDVTSAVTSEDGEPDFKFMVFDRWDLGNTIYSIRVRNFRGAPRVEALHPVYAGSDATLDLIERENLKAGYEGTMIRTPDSPYKFGRSTEKEGFLLKLKPFEDAEAVIIGFEEEMHNGNEATKDEVGRTKRSTAKAGKTGKDRLGKLLVRAPGWQDFAIGSGLTATNKTEIWAKQANFLGKIVKYKFQRIGSKDRPRCPVFLGFRSDIDT